MLEAPRDDDPEAARLRPRAWRQRHARRQRWRGRLVQDLAGHLLLLLVVVGAAALALAGSALLMSVGRASRHELAGLLARLPELAWPLGSLVGASIVGIFGLAALAGWLGGRRMSRSPPQRAWPWGIAAASMLALALSAMIALAPPRRRQDDLEGTAPGFDSALTLTLLLAMLVGLVLLSLPTLARWLTASLSWRVVHRVLPGAQGMPPPHTPPGATSLGTLRLRNANLMTASRRRPGRRDIRAWYSGGGRRPLTLRGGEAVGVQLPPGQVVVELVAAAPSRSAGSLDPREPWRLDCPVVAGHLTTVTARHPGVGVLWGGYAPRGDLVVTVDRPRPGRPTVPWPWRPPRG